MRTAGVARFLLASSVLAMSAAAGYAAGTPSSTTPVATAGTYFLNFDVTGMAPVPAGTTLMCRARVLPNLASGKGLNVSVGEGRGIVYGSKARCAVQIPLLLAPGQAQAGSLLSYEIVAVLPAGATVWSVADQGIAVAYPAAGMMVRVDFALRYGAR